LLKKSIGKITLMGIETPLTFGNHIVDHNSKPIMLKISG
jgi:hypothetical protein